MFYPHLYSIDANLNVLWFMWMEVKQRTLLRLWRLRSVCCDAHYISTKQQVINEVKVEMFPLGMSGNKQQQKERGKKIVHFEPDKCGVTTEVEKIWGCEVGKTRVYQTSVTCSSALLEDRRANTGILLS